MIKVRSTLVRGKAQWVLDTNISGKRSRAFFASEEAARSVATSMRKSRTFDAFEWLHLSPDKRSAIVGILRDIEASGLTLRTVWDAYRTPPVAIKCPDILTVITQMIVAKRAANCRASYINTLEAAMIRFATGREKVRIDMFTTKDVEEFAATGKALSSQKSLVFRCASLFSFAKRRGYILRSPCDGIEPMTIEQGQPHVFTLDQCRVALRWAMTEKPRLVPWLVLGLFAGLRPEEADQMTWESIGPTWCKVDADQTKVRQRRIVSCEPTVMVWLDWCRDHKVEMPLSHYARRNDQRDLRLVLGLTEWPKDVLRHTAATYMLLLHKSAPQVALNIGNSPEILLRNYRGMVADPDPTAFWAIAPSGILASVQGTYSGSPAVPSAPTCKRPTAHRSTPA